MTEEANKIVAELEGLGRPSFHCLYNEDWHKGVIGIVASRLTEIYYRPAVVLTRTDDMATGSARSVSGFDVYKAIEYCRDFTGKLRRSHLRSRTIHESGKMSSFHPTF